eukprot:COSAG04_NODE_29517_length_268_cov_0.917160_1_plen_66_part_10
MSLPSAPSSILSSHQKHIRVNLNCLALQYASKELRGNREIVQKAVDQSWLALQYASEELRGDREIV